jgi:hypothetical protein
MAIEVTIDTSEFQACIDRTIAAVTTFSTTDMKHELEVWQIEDMHRHYPNTEEPTDGVMTTSVWPRSRLSKKQRPVHSYTYTRHVPRRFAVPHHLTSHRPILREELWLRLCDRMDALLGEKITWKVK